MAEAVTRPTRRCVPINDSAPHEGQALHRVREQRSGARPALLKAGHGFMPASGIGRPQGGTTLRPAVVEQLASAKATRTALRPERCRKVREECGAREAQLASSQEPLDTLAA